MKADLKFIDHNFYGSRPVEVVLAMKDSQHSFYDIDMMKKVEEIENYLKDSLKVGSVISPISLFKGANKAFHGGENSWFRIPDSVQQVSRFAEAIYQTEYADEMQRWMLQDGSSARISGRLADVGSKEFNLLSQKFDHFFSDHKYAQSFSYKFTGPAVLFDKIMSVAFKKLLIKFIVCLGLCLLAFLWLLNPASNKNHLAN